MKTKRNRNLNSSYISLLQMNKMLKIFAIKFQDRGQRPKFVKFNLNKSKFI